MNENQTYNEILKASQEHKKTVEKHSALIKTLTESFVALKENGFGENVKIYAKSSEVNEKLDKINKDINALTDKVKTSQLKVESYKRWQTVDGLALELERSKGLNVQGFDAFREAKSILEDPFAKEYKKSFFHFIKNTRDPSAKSALFEKQKEIKEDTSVSEDDSYIKKSLNTIVGEQGGYFCPPEMDLMIQRVLFETSPIRMVADVRTTTSGAYEWPLRTSLPTAVWGDSQFDVDDNDASRYGVGRIEVQELKSLPSVSLNMLEDSVINIEADLRSDLAEAFRLAENKAFIKGDGIKQPRGLEFYAGRGKNAPSVSEALKIKVHSVSVADAKDNVKGPNALLDMESKILSAYKNDAYWLISRGIKNIIRQFRDGNNQFLFSLMSGWGGFAGVPSIRDGLNGRINGYPILECDDLPGTFSATAGSNFPIYFGNFKKYIILQRIGLMLIRDNITDKGFLKLFFRKRIGAGLKLGQGIVVMRNT